MQSLHRFVVSVTGNTQDSVTTESGLTLFIDTRFNEFQHRVMEGTIVSTPAKYETGAKPGDTLYFHHRVVMEGGQLFELDEKNQRMVNFDPDTPINSQAYAYKCQETGEIHQLVGWCLLDPIAPKGAESKFIEVVEKSSDTCTEGRVIWDSPWLQEEGISVGDVVGFRPNIDYAMKVDGRDVVRLRIEDLMYATSKEDYGKETVTFA